MISPVAAQVKITFQQARPVVEALRPSLPAAIRGLSIDEMEARWPSWVERHDRDVRARLARGDEDSLVNLWLYGTSFTSAAPAIARDAGRRADVEDLARTRLEDFLAAVSAPEANERLQFARRVLSSRGTDPATGEGKSRARQFMLEARRRMTLEFADSDRLLASAAREGAGTGAAATIFRERGLSSDTSILADYSVATAVDAITNQRLLRPGEVRRVAIVGPGLDFTNKADGYDFYPQQTSQPFALVDTLRRTGLAASTLRVTTFDISERVNQHLAAAVAQAGSPRGYVLTLPLDDREERRQGVPGDSERWTKGLLAYWELFGRAIGDETPALRPPPSAGPVRVRAVRVRPDVVRSIAAHDLNIVVDRLPLAPDERLDLVVATNVLVYYDVFEQALAVANIASMLRPGGVLLTNTAVLPTPPMKSSASYLRVAHTDQRYDEMFWYVRD
jgi:SAM-dependent methyltransferase